MKQRQTLLVAIGVLWLCATGAALGILFNFETTPGAIAAAPGLWPANSQIQLDLWRSAAVIPGVTVLTDERGREATRFGAAVSGQTLLYDPHGRLLFSGGITAARGHSGDNAGRNAIVTLITGGRTERTQTSVFGCPLHDPNQKTLQEERSWKKSVE